jgi:riboflavin biosynthesis pyrimidine reductase
LVPETDVRRLRRGFDAVLYADGEVKEATANSHGRDILHLPTEPWSATHRALYVEGVRFVLLVGGTPLAERYLAIELVDRVVAFGADDDQGSRWFDAFGLTGFDITRIVRESDGLRVEWQRTTKVSR